MMDFPVDPAYKKIQRIQTFLAFPFLLVLLYFAVRFGLLASGDMLVTSAVSSIVTMCIVQFFVKPEFPNYLIEGSRLRIHANAAYPIERIHKIHLKRANSGAFRLMVFAHEMTKLRTPALLNGDKLAKRLQAINPGIELVGDLGNT